MADYSDNLDGPEVFQNENLPFDVNISENEDNINIQGAEGVSNQGLLPDADTHNEGHQNRAGADHVPGDMLQNFAIEDILNLRDEGNGIQEVGEVPGRVFPDEDAHIGGQLGRAEADHVPANRELPMAMPMPVPEDIDSVIHNNEPGRPRAPSFPPFEHARLPEVQNTEDDREEVQDAETMQGQRRYHDDLRDEGNDIQEVEEVPGRVLPDADTHNEGHQNRADADHVPGDMLQDFAIEDILNLSDEDNDIQEVGEVPGRVLPDEDAHIGGHLSRAEADHVPANRELPMAMPMPVAEDIGSVIHNNEPGRPRAPSFPPFEHAGLHEVQTTEFDWEEVQDTEDTVQDFPIEEIFAEPMQGQWRYDGDFRETILARDSGERSFLHAINFYDWGANAVAGTGRQEAFMRFSQFLVLPLASLQSCVGTVPVFADDVFLNADEIANFVIETGEVNNLPEISPELFQLIFNLVFKRDDKKQINVIDTILGGGTLNVPNVDDNTETWRNQVVIYLTELYTADPEKSQRLRLSHLHCGSFDYNEINRLAQSLNRSDYMIFRQARKLFHFFGEVLNLRTLPQYANIDIRQALALFMRVFIIEHSYTIEYERIAEILEMEMDGAPCAVLHEALLLLFARWCAAILYEYRHVKITNKELALKTLNKVKKKPRGEKRNSKKDGQDSPAPGRKRKASDANNPSSNNQSYKRTQRSSFSDLCDVLFLTSAAQILVFMWESIVLLMQHVFSALWYGADTSSGDPQAPALVHHDLLQCETKKEEIGSEVGSCQDEASNNLQLASKSPNGKSKVHFGVSIDFLRLFARFIKQHAPQFEALDEYDLVGALSQTENDDEEDRIPEWTIWKLSKPKQQEPESQSLIQILQKDEGNTLRMKLLACAKTKEESDPRTWFGPATDYVCYAWKTKFKDLVNALAPIDGEPQKKHSRTPDEKYLWLDLFAVPQYRRSKKDAVVVGSLGDEDRALRQTVVQIINSTRDSVIVVMDGFSEPKVLTRRWCWYEIALALESNKSLSIAIPNEAKLAINKRLNNWDGPDSAVVQNLAKLVEGLSLHQSQCSKESDSKFIAHEIDNLSIGTTIDAKVRAAVMQLILQPIQEYIFLHKAGNVDPERFLSYFESFLDLPTLARTTFVLAPIFTIKGANRDGIRLMDVMSKKIRERLESRNSNGPGTDTGVGAAENQDLRNILGDILTAKGRMLGDLFKDDAVDEAIASFQESIKIREEMLDPKLYVTYYQLGRTLINMHMAIFDGKWTNRKRDEDVILAEESLRKSVKLQECLESHPAELGATYVHLAKALDLSGAPSEKSEELFQRALEIQSSKYGPGDQRFFLTTKCYGMSLAFHRRYSRAINEWYSCFHQLQLGTMQSSVPAYHLVTLLRWIALGFAQLERSNSSPNVVNRRSSFSHDYAQPALLELAINRKDLYMDSYERPRLLEITHWIHTVTPRALIIQRADSEATGVLTGLLGSFDMEIFKAETIAEAEEYFQRCIFAFVFIMDNGFSLQDCEFGPFLESTSLRRENDEPRTVFLHFTSESSTSDTLEEALMQRFSLPSDLVEKSMKTKDLPGEIKKYMSAHSDRFRFWDKVDYAGGAAFS